MHDLYLALGLPLAGTWLAQPRVPWQMQVAPAMDRIVKAEAVAMRMTLADLLADVRSPARRRWFRRCRRDGLPSAARSE